MKKFILGAAVLGLAFVATSSASALTNYGNVLIKLGSRSEDVKTVQMCLSEMGYSNAGSFDGIYGLKTLAQVKSYQADKGLAQDGIVGPITWAALDCEGTDETDTTGTVSSDEEAEVTVEFEAEDDLSADKKDQLAFSFEVEADEDGGDAQVNRVDLVFAVTPQAGGEDDLYDIIEKVTVEVDGKEVASKATDDDDDWTGSDDTIRLSGINTIVKSDKTVKFDVLLDIADLDESDDLDLDIELVSVEVRYTDGAGITDVVEDDTTSTQEVTVEALGDFDIDLTENKNSPEDADSLDLSEDIDEHTMVILDAEVDDEQDGTLQDAEVDLTYVFAGTATAANIDDVVDAVYLVVDGKKVEAESNPAVAGSVLTYEFDLDDIEVSAEDEFEVEVLVDFKSFDSEDGYAGTTVKVSAVRFMGEDEDGDDFPIIPENTSYAPVFTMTAGAIDIDFTEEPVAFRTSNDTNTGTIEFTLMIENNTGDDLTGLLAAANWTFDVEGYGGVTVTSVTEGLATLTDGDDDEYEFVLSFTSISSQDFTITVEEIGVENVPVSVTWEE